MAGGWASKRRPGRGRGGGWSFRPRRSPRPPPPPPPPPGGGGGGGGRGGRVLIIDDEPGLREILSEALRLDGHEVVTADSGRAALGAFARRAFDLVLTDLGMPDISGVELARELKATRPDLPVGLISGWDVSEESLRAQGATV